MRACNNDLGAIIKTARINKGLTQEALAETCGVGSRHIMGIENEGSYPGFELLSKLIRELNISVNSIFYPEKLPSTRQREYLIHLLEQCNDRDILAVTSLVESFLSKPDNG